MKMLTSIYIVLLLISTLATGCIQPPEPGDLPPPPAELVPEAGGRQVCLTINSEVNVINARGERRVEPAGVSFVTNSGAARIESAGRVLYDNVRIVPSCEDEPAAESDETEPGPEPAPAAVSDNSPAVFPIAGGGVIPAAGDGGGLNAAGSIGGGGGGGGGFGGAAGLAGAAAASGSAFSGTAAVPTTSAIPRATQTIASPTIPGN